MITIKYVENMATKPTTAICKSCGKSHERDCGMIQVNIGVDGDNHLGFSTFYLCSKCRIELYHKI